MPGYLIIDGFDIPNKYFFVDIDECADGQNRCDEQAVCINTIGSFKCDCKPGYNGDGFTCRGL